MELSAGNRVGGYALLARLSSSGLADVWLARDTSSKGHIKTVVVKTITRRRSASPGLLATIFAEAKDAADLDHANIVSVFDVAPHLDSFYIAMEHVAGRTLRHIVTQLHRQRLVVPEALAIHAAECACDALAYAHTRKRNGEPSPIIHRNIRPENIILSFTGDIKLLAFGTSRCSMIDPNHANDSPYLPASTTNEELHDSQSSSFDIYALGITIAECLTGDVLCWNDGGWSDNETPSLRTVAPWISAELESIVIKAIAPSPSDRYSSAMEFRKALVGYAKRNAVELLPGQLAKYLCEVFTEEPEASNEPCSLQPLGPDRRLEASRKSELPRSLHLDWAELAPLSMRETDLVQQFPPIPAQETLGEMAPASSNPPASPRSEVDERSHVWDLLTERVRAERSARETSSERLVELEASTLKVSSKPPPPSAPHGWDAAVLKAKSTEGEHVKSVLMTPAERAIKVFDEGLVWMRERNFDRAYELWAEAAALDPENRLYQTNLRRLRRLMEEQPSG